MNVFELTPIDGRKSFYGKATVIKEDNKYVLISYTTRVARYDEDNDIFTLHNMESLTTRRHINAFRDYFGLSKLTKKQMEKLLTK